MNEHLKPAPNGPAGPREKADSSLSSKRVNPEPLRVAADLLQEGHPPGNHVLAKYFHDAADEIERLRAIILDAHGTLYHGDCNCSVCSLPETGAPQK